MNKVKIFLLYLLLTVTYAQEPEQSFPAGSDPKAEQKPFYRACISPDKVSVEVKYTMNLMKEHFDTIDCYWDWENLYHEKELGWADDKNIVDISPFTGLDNLESLYLYNNQIQDITSLEGLINLKELKLHQNQISNLQPLSELIYLEYLTLNGNKITDISPLRKLKNLKTLYLHDNQIKDITPLVGLKQLENLTLWDNPIDKIHCPIGSEVPKELDSFCREWREEGQNS